MRSFITIRFDPHESSFSDYLIDILSAHFSFKRTHLNALYGTPWKILKDSPQSFLGPNHFDYVVKIV